MRSTVQILSLLGVILMANCKSGKEPVRGPSPRQEGARAGWVIDGKRITYDGVPIPFGATIDQFEKLFGPASDSTIKPWPGHRNMKVYFWDDQGMKSEIWSDRHPDRIGGMQIYFRQAEVDPADGQGNRRPKGSSSIELKPHGTIDSGSVETVLRKGFHSSFALRGDEPRFLELELEKGYWLSILPERAGSGNFQSISIHLNAPDLESPLTYPELFARLGNERGTSKPRKDSSEDAELKSKLKAGLDAAKQLQEAGIENVGAALKNSLDADSTRSLLDRALDSVRRRNPKK